MINVWKRKAQEVKDAPRETSDMMVVRLVSIDAEEVLAEAVHESCTAVTFVNRGLSVTIECAVVEHPRHGRFAATLLVPFTMHPDTFLNVKIDENTFPELAKKLAHYKTRGAFQPPSLRSK